uniref:Uncharacterized protein n=1 Tax=Arundo donax TaxID=35708 RepID=A0A0A8Z1S5_ARUDO
MWKYPFTGNCSTALQAGLFQWSAYSNLNLEVSILFYVHFNYLVHLPVFCIYVTKSKKIILN